MRHPSHPEGIRIVAARNGDAVSYRGILFTAHWKFMDLGRSWCFSFYWASVAKAPNVLQPYWHIVLPLDVPALSASLLLWGPIGQRWRCLWTFLFSNVSNLRHWSSSRDPSSQRRNYMGRWILPKNTRLPRNIQGSFTCRKFTTWDRRLYFPSEGRRAEEFFFLPW